MSLFRLTVLQVPGTTEWIAGSVPLVDALHGSGWERAVHSQPRSERKEEEAVWGLTVTIAGRAQGPEPSEEAPPPPIAAPASESSTPGPGGRSTCKL